LQLSTEELASFTQYGFLAKRGLIDESECDTAVDVAWDKLAELKIGKQPAQWKTQPQLKRKMGVIKLRESVNSNQQLNKLASNESVRSIVEQLIGPNIECRGVRGVYPTFPVSRLVARPYEPHIEMHSVQVFIMYYLDDVSEKSGGLYAWPGSHIPIYKACRSKFDYLPSADFTSVYNQYNLSKPLDLTGNKGDVIFLHHRMLHSGSNNFSSKVRFGMLVDYTSQNFEEIRQQPPTDDIWEDWSEAVQQAAKTQDAKVLPQKSLARSIKIQLIHAIRKARGIPPRAYAE
jgi:hypothetical protein